MSTIRATQLAHGKKIRWLKTKTLDCNTITLSYASERKQRSKTNYQLDPVARGVSNDEYKSQMKPWPAHRLHKQSKITCKKSYRTGKKLNDGPAD